MCRKGLGVVSPRQYEPCLNEKESQTFERTVPSGPGLPTRAFAWSILGKYSCIKNDLLPNKIATTA